MFLAAKLRASSTKPLGLVPDRADNSLMADATSAKSVESTNTPLPCGRIYTMPLSLIAGLTGCLAVLTAQLPWYALPALAAIPPAAKIPLPAKGALWVQSLLLSAVTLACAAGAAYLTWHAAGAPPL